MKIVLAAGESVPFCKTGGLADVVGALTQRLGRLGHEVRLFLPKYRAVEGGAHSLRAVPGAFPIPVGDGLERASLAAADWGPVTVYFVENPKYFGREGLYGMGGKDYEDNDERFLFFSRAVLEGSKYVDFRPDVIHCHDWQSAVIPAYLRRVYHTDAFFARTGAVLTLHNIAYQGFFGKDALYLAGFGWGDFTPDRLEYYGGFNFLKSGLVFADRLNTVSPAYAREIQGSNEFGRGLEGVLRQRARDLTGILNGIDVETWNPETDPTISRGYGADSAAEGKAECRRALRSECGLDESDGPLAGVVSRLDPQKGLDIVLQLLPGFVASGGQLVVLGDGQPELRGAFAAAASRWPRSVHLHSGFDEAFAHRVYAGADLFLMPSRFEPCGLGQMIAMRYGTIPVVTATGGLCDTVHETGSAANGFVAERAAPEPVESALRRALAERARPDAWARRRANAMAADFSWDRSAQAYVTLYEQAAAARRLP